MDDNNRPDSKLLKILDHCLRTVILALMFCVGFILGVSIFGHALCYADEPAAVFEVPRMTGASAEVIRSQGTSVGTYTVSSSVYPVYVGIFPNTWAGENDIAALYVSNNRVYALLFSQNASGGVNSSGVLRSAYSSTTGTNNYGSMSVTDDNLNPSTVSGSFAEVNMCASATFSTAYTLHTSRQEAAQAIYDYITYPPAETDPDHLYNNLTIPAGYAARILVSSSNTLTFNTVMPAQSKGFTLSPPWSFSTQLYKYSDQYSFSVINTGSGITIPWQRYGDLNALGRTKNAVYTFSPGVGTYLWIINPMYYGQDDTIDGVSTTPIFRLNGNIVLTSYTGPEIQVRLFSLTTSVQTPGTFSQTTSEEDEIEVVGSTDGAITYVKSDGTESTSLSPGGNTSPEVTEDDSGLGIVERLQLILNNLISRIESLLVAPTNLIQQLISSSSAFMNALSTIWTWLPAPLMTVMKDVLYILMVVGALKLLWR